MNQITEIPINDRSVCGNLYYFRFDPIMKMNKGAESGESYSHFISSFSDTKINPAFVST